MFRNTPHPLLLYNAADAYSRYVNLFPRSRQTSPGISLGAKNTKATCYFIPLSYQIFNREMQVKENSGKYIDLFFVVLPIDHQSIVGIMTHAARVVELVDSSDVFLVYQVHATAHRQLYLYTPEPSVAFIHGTNIVRTEDLLGGRAIEHFS